MSCQATPTFVYCWENSERGGREKARAEIESVCVCYKREGGRDRETQRQCVKKRKRERDVELNGCAGAAGALCVWRWWRLELMAAALLLGLRTTAPNFTECSTSLKRTGLDRQQGFLEVCVCMCVYEMRLGARLTGAWWKAALIGHWLSLRGVVHTGTDRPEFFCHRSTQLWTWGRQEQNLAVLNCPFRRSKMSHWKDQYKIYAAGTDTREARTTVQAGGYFQS